MKSRVLKISNNINCKLDCELDYGSYKVRGVTNYFKKSECSNFEVLSAGNLASACVGEAIKHGVNCTPIVPEKISRVKEEKIISMGGTLKKVPFLDLWSLVEKKSLIHDKEILHPIHPLLIEGYEQIIDELINQVEDFENIFIPYGLGGLALGVVRAKRRLKANFKIYLVEIEGHSPFKSCLNNSENIMGSHLKSFIEAMGAPRVLDFVFDEIKSDINEVVLVSEKDVKDSIVELFQRHQLKVEGAAGAALAGAKKLNLKNSIALLTGENISSDIFEGIIDESDN